MITVLAIVGLVIWFCYRWLTYYVDSADESERFEMIYGSHRIQYAFMVVAILGCVDMAALLYAIAYKIFG